ncbi:Organic cation transporter protein [Chionoecetes opilio]|uniref:Organic cation transporter protein n=1 Tax=Chionoecetes opilio TaxID=41210 RepID=A0A8J4XZT8_CHIOP|nr:Organic cation transporter protein [Chionoecetes opilio]
MASRVEVGHHQGKGFKVKWPVSFPLCSDKHHHDEYWPYEVIDESPLWLIVNGRPQEALQVFGKVARWHGIDLPPEAEMKKLVEEQAAEAQNTTPKRSSMGSLLKSFVDDVVILLKTPRLRTITLIIYFIYIVVAMVYYGLSFSGASISDDPYLYLVLSGLMELPAYICSGCIAQHFGRESSLIFSFLISTVVLLALASTPAAHEEVCQQYPYSYTLILFMGCVEEEVFKKISMPDIYCRYIDDIFIKTKSHYEAEQLKLCLQDTSGLTCTIESTSDKSMPFLDVLVTKQEETLITNVYVKPTNTGHCLNGESE